MGQLTIRELQEQINKLNKEVAILKGNTKSSLVEKNLGIGSTFELAGLKWKILDITDKGYMCLVEELEEIMGFDFYGNNWRTSSLRNYLNTSFYMELSNAIGADNIISFERDLLSFDGQTEYGTCKDKVSLLTVDEYRKHRKLIPNTDYWWWLITPWSTPCNNYKISVTVVSSLGDFENFNCVISCGVRPVCIFSSSIFGAGN